MLHTKHAKGSGKEQTEAVIMKLKTLLAEAGGTLADLVWFNVYIKNIKLYIEYACM